MQPDAIDEAVTAVQRAFSKQARHFDHDDVSNPVLVRWRKQVYQHLDLFLKPGSRILEINAGTGIDALHLVRAGHRVHATDVSAGMIQKIQEKIIQFNLNDRLTATQCSFESLDTLQDKNFDYLLSNFGGLNCCKDLSLVCRSLPNLLRDGACITWVIMPPVSLWELAWVLQGKKSAFRRFGKNGTVAHLEGEFFNTYYHSLTTVREKLGARFQLMKTEGLGAFSPPPGSLSFVMRHFRADKLFRKIDGVVRNHFPFDRCADHFIATFKYNA